MENHNAEQVKKALEHCKSPKLTKCDGCPRENEDGHCMYRLNEDAHALIKELSEENEKIGIENFDLVCELSRIKEDTVRKMQERLTDFFANDAELEYIEVDANYINERIDQIAKEVLEGE